MKKLNILLILILAVALSNCDVESPVKDVKLNVNAEVEETIIESQSISESAPQPVTLINEATIGGNSSVKTNSFLAETSFIKANVGQLQSGMVAFSGNLTNNSGNDVEVVIYLATSGNLTSPTGGFTVDTFTLTNGQSESINTDDVPSFVPGSYYVYIFATGDPNLNVAVSNFAVNLPATKNIQTRINESDEDFDLNEILDTDFSGSIENNGSAPLMITVYLSTGSYSNSDGNLLASHTIAVNENYTFSKSTLDVFNQTLYENLITTYVNNQVPLYSWIVLSSSNDISIVVDDVKIKSELEVSTEL